MCLALTLCYGALEVVSLRPGPFSDDGSVPVRDLLDQIFWTTKRSFCSLFKLFWKKSASSKITLQNYK